MFFYVEVLSTLFLLPGLHSLHLLGKLLILQGPIQKASWFGSQGQFLDIVSSPCTLDFKTTLSQRTQMFRLSR